LPLTGLVLSVFLTLIVEQTSAQVNVTDIITSNDLVFNGTCPKVAKSPQLDVSLMLGSWYLQYLNPGILYRGKKCAISILSLENGTIYLKEYLTDIR
jgi:hypothetical protein